MIIGRLGFVQLSEQRLDLAGCYIASLRLGIHEQQITEFRFLIDCIDYPIAAPLSALHIAARQPDFPDLVGETGNCVTGERVFRQNVQQAAQILLDVALFLCQSLDCAVKRRNAFNLVAHQAIPGPGGSAPVPPQLSYARSGA